MSDLLEIGNLIKSTRKQQELSQYSLSGKAGVSRARIEALENGRIPEIGFKHLLRILNALGLDLRITTLNNRRPTLDDLIEEEALSDAAGMVR